MEPSLFRKLLLQADDFIRKPLVHLYGGEPLLHRRFPEFVALLDEHGFKATINTNGELLAERAADLARGPVKMVNVSLDAPGDRHDVMRHRPGLFAAAVEGMKLLRSMDERIKINVNYVVSDKNAGSISSDAVELERLLHGAGVDYFSIEQMAFTADSMARAGRIDAGALIDEMAILEKMKFAFPVTSTPVVRQHDLGKYYGSMEPFDGLNCNVPWIGLNVMPGGTATPGGGMFECTKPCGNINSDTLRTIWNGEEMRRFRRRTRQAMPRDCFRCCHTQHYSRMFRCRPASFDALPGGTDRSGVREYPSKR